MANELDRTLPRIRCPKLLLHCADWALHGLHLGIIGFFLVGWLHTSTRLAHLILSMLILVSWVVLGSFRGFGYCLVTDIQWRLKRLMGNPPVTEYYVKHVVDGITGRDTKAALVNAVTTYTYAALFAVSAVLYAWYWSTTR